MRKLKINREDFEAAFLASGSKTTAYLDTDIGAAFYIEDEVAEQLTDVLSGDEKTLEEALAAIQAEKELDESDRGQLINAARVEWDEDYRYLPLPKQSPHEVHEDMEEYIESLEDDRLADLLAVAIQGAGAFRRFKEVLVRFPEARENWFKFQEERQRQRMLDWLESEEIDPLFE